MQTVKYLVEVLLYLIMVMAWLAGLVIAKGFLSTTFAIFPPYAWYLVIELIMIKEGVV